MSIFPVLFFRCLFFNSGLFASPKGALPARFLRFRFRGCNKSEKICSTGAKRIPIDRLKRRPEPAPAKEKRNAFRSISLSRNSRSVGRSSRKASRSLPVASMPINQPKAGGARSAQTYRELGGPSSPAVKKRQRERETRAPTTRVAIGNLELAVFVFFKGVRARKQG